VFSRVLLVLLDLVVVADIVLATRGTRVARPALAATAMLAAASFMLVAMWGGLCYFSPWCAGPNGGVGILLSGAVALFAAIVAGAIAATIASRAYGSPKYRRLTVFVIAATSVVATLLWTSMLRNW
jgi:hypothetical protein